MDNMVVEVELGRVYLSRGWKLMLICGKIKQTMRGAGHHGNYVWIFNLASIHRLVSLARASDLESFKCLWVPDDFPIEGCPGSCRVC